MRLKGTRITLEESAERLKITLPVKRNQLAIAIYTVLALVWFGGLILFIYLLFNPPTPRGVGDLPPSLGITWFIGVLLWLYVWVRYMGRMIMRWWQYYLADREILFIDDKTLILRRPVSILGLTDAYDRQYVSPFMLDGTHNSLTFRYGNVQHILFGGTLSAEEQRTLQTYINDRYFPHHDEDDDE